MNPLTPILAALAIASSQGNVSVPLVEDSKNQPAFAVLVGDSVYFAEAFALEENDGLCPAQDIYRVRIGERKEERLQKLPCVTEIRSFGGDAYFVHRSDKDGLKVVRVTPKGIDEDFTEAVETAQAKAVFQRVAQGLPRKPSFALLGLVPQKEILSAVFHVGGEKPAMLAVPVAKLPRDGKLPEPRALPAEAQPPRDLVVTESGKWFALRKAAKGRLELVALTEGDAASIVPLGGKKALPKDWKEASQDRWFASAPRYLTAGAGELYVADRTSEAFTEKLAISALDPAKKEFRCMAQVPAEDVGGLYATGGGLLVSKPLAGNIVWYGPRSAVPESLKKLTASNAEGKKSELGGKR